MQTATVGTFDFECSSRTHFGLFKPLHGATPAQLHSLQGEAIGKKERMRVQFALNASTHYLTLQSSSLFYSQYLHERKHNFNLLGSDLQCKTVLRFQEHKIVQVALA